MKSAAIVLGGFLAACAATPQVPTAEPMAVHSRIKVADEITALAASDDSIWVAVLDEDLVRIDAQTGKTTASFLPSTGQLPGGADQIAIAGDDVWAAVPIGTSPPGWGPGATPTKNMMKVYKDFETRTVDVHARETAGGIVHIDARTNETRRTLLFLDHTPSSIAATAGGAWVPTEGGLRRLDPAGYRFGAVTGPTAESVIADQDQLYLLSSSQIARFDTATGETAFTVTPTDLETVEGFHQLAVDGDALFVTTGNELVKLSATDGSLLGRVPLDHPWDVAAADGIVLTLDLMRGTLTRLDAETLSVIDTLTMKQDDNLSNGLVIAAGSAWLAHGRSIVRVTL